MLALYSSNPSFDLAVLDLCCKLLEYDPQRRIPAAYALSHPFIASKCSPKERQITAPEEKVPVKKNQKTRKETKRKRQDETRDEVKPAKSKEIPWSDTSPKQKKRDSLPLIMVNQSFFYHHLEPTAPPID